MTETTRTPEPEDADASEHTSTGGTPEQDERDAQVEDVASLKAQLLQTKLDREEFNKAQARVRELEAQVAERQDAPPATEPDDDEDDPDLRGAMELANQKDPLARLYLKDRERQNKVLESIARGTVNRFALIEELPEKEKRNKVLAYITAERKKGRTIDIKAAVTEMDSATQQERITALEAELARHKETPPDTVRTYARDVGATEAKKRKMTPDQVVAEQTKLRQQGRHREAMELPGKVDF